MRGIATKFWLPVGLFVAAFSAFIIARTFTTTRTHTQELMAQQAALALEFDVAIRKYVADHIRPAMEKHVGKDAFDRETMSTSYVARRVFDDVRRRFPDYILKFSSANPRNPANQAGPEELAIIDYFKQHPDQNTWVGEIRMGGKPYMGHFRARRAENDCLRCHGDPEDAPRALVRFYGKATGFHHRLGEVMALDTVAVPLDAVNAAARNEVLQHSAAIVVGLVLLSGGVFWTFRTVVSKRLRRISQHFARISAKPSQTPLELVDEKGRDEIGDLAISFNRLAGRLQATYVSLEEQVQARTAELAAANEGLRREIAERNRAEEQARVEAREKEAILSGLKDVLVEYVDPQMRVIWCNSAMSERAGKPAGDLLGTPCFVSLHGRQAPCDGCTAAKAIETGQFQADEIVTPDGRTMSLRSNPLKDADGRVRGVVHVGMDISDRRRTEEELQQNAVALEAANKRLEQLYGAAEAASRAKSEFLANMSHEIRTPMTAILGFTESLLEPGLSDEDRHAAVETIRRNGNHLLQVINDILDLSKIEAGKLAAERVWFSPVELVEEVRDLLTARAADKGLSLSFEYAGAIAARVQSDPTRVRQILINLLGNAIKFTEAGGVRLVVAMAKNAAGQPLLQFDVIDSGIGMTAEQVAALFQPFAQADTSTTRKFGGSGLGLAICKRLTELLGGDIAVESAQGKGSRFRATVAAGSLDEICLIDQPAAAAGLEGRGDWKAVATPVPERLECRVLLAEDAPDNQRLIGFVLKKAGAQVAIAENGEFAYQMAAAAWKSGQPFDVILMDMQMPVLDGYAATRRLRDEGYPGVIIALTAHAMAEDRTKCLEAGCNDYVTKPIDHKKLVATVATHLSRYSAPRL